MDKGTLIAAFHQEMRDLAVRCTQLMSAAEEALSKGVSEHDLGNLTTEDARALARIRDAYFDYANDLEKRFQQAAIGDWNEHMTLSGARKIIDDDLKLRP